MPVRSLLLRITPGLLTSLQVMVSSPPASFAGEPSDPSALTATDTARKLFDDGNAALSAGDYERACRLFEESFSISQANGPLFQWARCEDARGRLATALGLWQRVRDRVVDQAEVQEEARRRIEELSSRVARLTIRLRPDAAPESRVELDGRVVLLDTPITVDAGDRRVVVKVDGAPDQESTVSIQDGQNESLEVGGPVAPTTLPSGVSSTPIAPDAGPASHPPYQTIGFILLGVGVAGGAVFGVTAPMVLSAEDDLDALCPDRNRCDDPDALDVQSRGRTLTTVNTIGFVVGAVGLAGGVTLLIVDALAAPAEPPPVAGVFIPGLGGSVELSLRF